MVPPPTMWQIDWPNRVDFEASSRDKYLESASGYSFVCFLRRSYNSNEGRQCWSICNCNRLILEWFPIKNNRNSGTYTGNQKDRSQRGSHFTLILMIQHPYNKLSYCLHVKTQKLFGYFSCFYLGFQISSYCPFHVLGVFEPFRSPRRDESSVE